MTYLRTTILVLAALALAVSALNAGTAPGAKLELPEDMFPSLQGILKETLQESPQIISNRLSIEMAQGDYMQARSGLLPNVSGYYQQAYDEDRRADLPDPVMSDKIGFNLQLTQPLYHWNALRNNAKIGELRKLITEKNYADAYRQLAQQVRYQFMGLIIKKAALAAAQFDLQLTADRLHQAQEKLKRQVVAASEVGGAQVGFDQAKLATDRAAEDYAHAKALFLQLTGLDELNDTSIPDAIPSAPYLPEVVNSLLQGFLAQKDPGTYAAQSLQTQIAIEKLNYKNANVRLRPTMDFITGVSQSQQSYTTNIAAKYQVFSEFVGFQINWTIFDGFAARGAKLSSLARRRQLEQSYHDLTQSLAEQARFQAKDLGFAYRDMQFADQGLAGAEGTVKYVQNEVAKGQATPDDVRTAQAAVYSAKVSTYASRSTYLIKLGDFLSTIMKDPALDNLSTQQIP